MDEDGASDNGICDSCGGVKPEFAETVDPFLRRYAEWNITDNGTFLEMNGVLYTKPIETRVRLMGTSWGITFPKKVMEFLGLNIGNAVKIIIIPDPARDEPEI